MKIKFFDENFTTTKGISLFLDPKTDWKKDIEDYDVAIYTDRLTSSFEPDKNKINCAWIIEPPVINGENYARLNNNYQNFKYIFSYMKGLSNNFENFVFIPHGGTWIKEEDFSIYQKNKNISSIFSWKKWNSGHSLRHSIYSKWKDTNKMDFYGSGCDREIPYKLEGLKDYRFSIAIENSIEPDYFTEKILDCFLTGTIPIYYGTNEISEYFDSEGIIFIKSIEDLESIIDTLTEDFYMSKIESIKNNFDLAMKYIYPEKIIQKFLEENV